MKNTLHINRFGSRAEAAAAAGEALNSLLAANEVDPAASRGVSGQLLYEKLPLRGSIKIWPSSPEQAPRYSAFHNKNRPVLLLLSGGSSLEILDFLSPGNLGENLTVTVLDERFGGDIEANNFLQLQKTQFYFNAAKAKSSFFSTLPRDNETKKDLAKRWEKAIKNWRHNNSNGKIIASLGMGADGHTAGIFPILDDEKKFRQLFQSDAWVRAYSTGNENRFNQRITTTLTFFKLIDAGIAFVCGQEKKQKFDEATSTLGKPADLPALAWHEIKHIQIFTDIF